MTNPIDSLPATPETVGMPRVGDAAWCRRCDFYAVVMPYMMDDDKVVFCGCCRSYEDMEKVKP
jgi:hypothetical protein